MALHVCALSDLHRTTIRWAAPTQGCIDLSYACVTLTDSFKDQQPLAKMNEQLAPDYPYDRPIIIVAAPRSGSTMLFETLCHAKNLWTIGDESHMVFEDIKKLNPDYGICRSNRLTAEDADVATVNRIRRIFRENLCDRDGRLYNDVATGSAEKPRFLEKTPKNSLRIPFLNQVFPDARYIYLFREPRENISSIIEAWRSLDFVTYPQLPDWPGKWSLLLPPNYQQMKGKSLEEIAAYQWQAANRFILDDLSEMTQERWTAVSYAELLADTPATIQRLCRFADICFDERLSARCNKALPLSRYTQTEPASGKWRKNEAMIERVMPSLRSVIERIEIAVAPHSSSAVVISGPILDLTHDTQLERKSRVNSPGAGDAIAGRPDVQEDGRQNKILGRNARCDCGSGKRYKHCHGKILV